MPTLAEAVQRYLAEAETTGRSKKMGLRFLSLFAIGRLPLDRLTRADYAEHVMLRRRGVPDLGVAPIAASTALQELQYIRTVLKHAFLVWGLPVGWQELDFAAEGLAKSGTVAKSARRNRLPDSGELQRLTDYFVRRWEDPRHLNSIPMHLIMWLAIYTCRREDELCRMMLADYHAETSSWLIRDVKHPQGSAGNDKWFAVTDAARPVIAALQDSEVRRRMASAKGRAGSLIPLQAKSISANFTRACKVLGIADLRFHDLRHEGATRLAEDGLTIPQIQQITLHDSWGSLQRYVNPRRRPARLDFAEAMDKSGGQSVL